MADVLKLYSGRAFLGGRAVAHRVRTEAVRLLASRSDSVVVLDFEGVDGVSHSFGDELLSPLAELLDQAVAKRVKLANCSASTLADLRSVADMHRLPMPHVCAEVVAA
jgi:hypothetical protein